MENQKDEYKPLSEVIPKIMFKVMKSSTHVVAGFLFFRHRFVTKCIFDEEKCEELLKSMIINKENVLRYLRHKYVPTYNANGAIFKNQRCIQAVKVQEDGTLLIKIDHSEPHKIITDTMHVRSLLAEKGFKFTDKIKFVINQVQISFHDTQLYNVLLKEYGLPVPTSSKLLEREITYKYRRLEDIVSIKMNSIKRKFLRYRIKIGQMTWPQLRRCLKVDDFRPKTIKALCNEIREENRANGIDITY